MSDKESLKLDVSVFQALERNPNTLYVRMLYPRTPKGLARTTKVGSCARIAEPGKFASRLRGRTRFAKCGFRKEHSVMFASVCRQV